MARKITRKSLIRKCDALVKEIVIFRDKSCVTCGSKSLLEPGHLFTRQVLATRWLLGNVFAQCHSYNLRHEYDPFPLTNYFLGKFGKKAYEELHKVFWHPRPVKTWQIASIREELEAVLKTMKE